MSSGTEVWVYRLRSPNGGGGDRPRPFIIIAIWAQAFENRGNTVIRAHVSSSIGIIHPYYDEWGGLISCNKGILSVMRERNGGGCDRPRPFRVIAIRAGFVLAKYRGSTVTSAQVSRCVGLASAGRRLPV